MTCIVPPPRMILVILCGMLQQEVHLAGRSVFCAQVVLCQQRRVLKVQYDVDRIGEVLGPLELVHVEEGVGRGEAVVVTGENPQHYGHSELGGLPSYLALLRSFYLSSYLSVCQ